MWHCSVLHWICKFNERVLSYTKKQSAINYSLYYIMIIIHANMNLSVLAFLSAVARVLPWTLDHHTRWSFSAMFTHNLYSPNHLRHWDCWHVSCIDFLVNLKHPIILQKMQAGRITIIPSGLLPGVKDIRGLYEVDRFALNQY